MKGVTLNSLVLASSLVLLLPPGWCCFVPLPVITGVAKAAEQCRGGCRQAGRCKVSCKGKGKAPVQPPLPAPPCPYCCYEPDWLKPAPPEQVGADRSSVALAAPIDRPPAPTVLRHPLDLSLPDPSPPLHILKCVWLC
jgi:hypothetical protein